MTTFNISSDDRGKQIYYNYLGTAREYYYFRNLFLLSLLRFPQKYLRIISIGFPPTTDATGYSTHINILLKQTHGHLSELSYTNRQCK